MLTRSQRSSVDDPLHVAVIGAGFGGIAAALRLMRDGVAVTIFERSEGVGGTWWDNRYPGAETDAASHLYSFSYAPHDWSRTHVGQAEIQRYLEQLVTSRGLMRHIRFKETVERVVWDEAAAEYLVVTGAGEELRFAAVVSAVGIFSAPRRPSWPGLESFEGEVVHTAQWDESVQVAGKRVAVVGTGSSSVQVVPAVADSAARVLVFQRQPGWVLPKGDRDFTDWERRLFRWRPAQLLDRARLYLRQERTEWRGALFRPGSRHHRRAERRARQYVADVFAGRPDLAAAVTPDYPFAGKRTVISSSFYPALLRDDVELVPRAVASCTKRGLVDTAGTEHEVDLVVLATGFTASRYLASLDVTGRESRRLHEVWGEEPEALLGLMVPGFPNFFMMYGPNTNGGLIVSNFEHQAAFVAHQVRRLRRSPGSAVEARPGVVGLYNRWVQWRLAGTAWAQGSNYFAGPSGRIVTQWPEGAALFAVATKLLRRVGVRISR
jgi:cation diffusion facilitator CzcD-associated flavoprotein CzcO